MGKSICLQLLWRVAVSIWVILLFHYS